MATTPTSVSSKPADSEQQRVLKVLQRNQSEGNTAALLLAFSLGLACCFVGLVVVEFRRRRRGSGGGGLFRSSWRRQPKSIPVLFGGPSAEQTTADLPLRRDRKQRQMRDSIRRAMAADDLKSEENRSLCDGIVL